MDLCRIRIIDETGSQVEWQKYFKQEELISGQWESDAYWPAWKYIGDDKNCRPSFKYHNEAFYELLEEEGFSRFVDETMNVVDDFMKSLVL